MFRLDGKVALVTGAGSVGPGWGNGKATAVLLARQGAAIFAIDNQLAAVEETLGLIRAEKGTARAHVCDMTSSGQVSAAVDACIPEFGQLDILVNNVGGSSPGGAEGMAEGDWDGQIDLNLRTAFLGQSSPYRILGAGRRARSSISRQSPRFA